MLGFKRENHHRFRNCKIYMIEFAVCFSHNVKELVMRRTLLLITVLLGLASVIFVYETHGWRIPPMNGLV